MNGDASSYHVQSLVLLTLLLFRCLICKWFCFSFSSVLLSLFFCCTQLNFSLMSVFRIVQWLWLVSIGESVRYGSSLWNLRTRDSILQRFLVFTVTYFLIPQTFFRQLVIWHSCNVVAASQSIMFTI